MLRKHFILITVLLCFLTSSCGIKPSGVDAPSGSDPKLFPRTYPDPALDPK